ncbi:MAG: hypothetical protein A2W90_09015 [Bacteroidetes bacterium GWF2_42_66]|nr:MAG: hypothetical protein A2W92_17260 [Bacteroidetes bacterium GWA2_42_15]OFX97129.1 MAG: hypothetical protein A2W89_00140 [Bacteroidetes bacterium GWE2_42_39]OFY46200.1 MAG: hypothetical protein A2W90_09015 [Bacteroidetes bacterium GWF2_42_66]HBL78033.1 hypothetical protein [Prolixibacteraceae bacterium]HCR92067.1 hypothetical protein [Prolixibacteraceae bacterium]
MKHHFSDWPKEVLYYGSPASVPLSLSLQAGPLKMGYENGCIRQVKQGNTEILRMIYSAVRDQNWGTLDCTIDNENLSIESDRFKIVYTAKYRDVFAARYQLQGTPDGTITFDMEGEVLSDFKKNRIGFCVLHPVEECMGRQCVINYADKDAVSGVFPLAISAENPFKNIRSMRWKVLGNLEATLDFEGDIFEMEDQRNWTDSSYKTFCTPLDTPFPVLIKKGSIIRQKIVFRLSGNKAIDSDDYITCNGVDCDFTGSTDLPGLGLNQSGENDRLSPDEAFAIRQLRLDHLRCDIHLSDTHSAEKISQAFAESEQTNCRLELCLHFSSRYQEEFNKIKQLLKSGQNQIKHVVLFREKEKTTDHELLKALVPVMREILPSGQVGAGTDAFFAELNMHRMSTDLVDFVVYSINPQVHAFDNQTLVENLLAQKHTVHSARLFSGKADVFASPVTLKMRFNPDATDAQGNGAEDLAAKVDPRQMSLFTMGWTLGSMASLAGANTSSVTYFETAGLCGVMQGDRENRYPDRFYSLPHMFFPVYHLFKILSGYKNAKVYSCKLSDPLSFSALMLKSDEKSAFIMSNLTIGVKSINLNFDLRNYDRILRFNAGTFSDFAFDRDYTDKAVRSWKISHEISLLPFETIVLLRS